MLSGVFIVGAKRTAFGTFGGKLKNHSATDLGVIATVAALKHANVKADDIDHVIFGQYYVYYSEKRGSIILLCLHYFSSSTKL